MQSAEDTLHGEVGHGRIHVRHEMQARRTRPRAPHPDVGQIVGHELRDGGRAVRVRNDLEVHLRLAHLLDDGSRRARLAALDVVEQVLVLVSHGADSDLDAGVLERAGERVLRDRQHRLRVLLRKAPDFAATGNRRLAIEVHLRGEIDVLALVEGRNHDAGLRVVAESGAVGHADEFVEHRAGAIGLERLRERRANRIGIGLVRDDQILAIDEPVGPARVRRRRRGHRGQVEDVGEVHGQCAVQPPSMGMMAPVIEAAPSLARNATSAAVSSTCTNFFVGCAYSSTSWMTCSSVIPRARRPR